MNSNPSRPLPHVPNSTSLDVFGKLATGSLFASIVFSMGLLTFLWAEVRVVPSQAWTALAIVIIVIAIASNRADRMDDRRVTIAVGIYFALYGFFMMFSFLFFAEPHEEKLELLILNETQMVMGFVFYGFGVLCTSQRATPGFVAAFALLTIYILQHKAAFSIAELQRRFDEDQVNIGYQQLGDSLAICAMVLIARFKRIPVAFPLALLSIILLFIIPSRSAAVFGSIGLLVACMLLSSFRLKLALLGLAIIAAVAARVWISYSLTESFEGTRHETLFTEQEDSSNRERMEILEQGIKVIADNPIFGNFGFELDVFNERGRYIHNFLDVWAQAGLIPFLTLIALVVLIARQWFFMFLSDRDSAYRCLPLLVFGLLSWILSRAMVYPYLYFVFGFFSATLATSLRSTPTYPMPPVAEPRPGNAQFRPVARTSPPGPPNQSS